METTQIPFNYFYLLFKKIFQKEILELERKKIGKNADILSDIFGFYYTESLPKEEKLSIYNKALFEVCTNYVALSNADIDIFPADTLEFVNVILDTIHKNPYRESFLMSLQFIYQDYLECLGKGAPILMITQDPELLSSLKITLDSNYHITEFNAINMEMEEQDKIMTKIISMEKNNKIGPIPKTTFRFRKDI